MGVNRWEALNYVAHLLPAKAANEGILLHLAAKFQNLRFGGNRLYPF